MPSAVTPMAAWAPSVPVRDWAPGEILLSPTTSAEMSAAIPAKPDPPPVQIGFARPVPPLEDSSSFAARRTWHPTPPGGHAFAFAVTSPEAEGVRLGLRVAAIPDEATVRFYDRKMLTVHSVSGVEIKATIQRNLAAGEMGEDAETYWSPVTEGESQIMDIELPPGTDPGEIAMAVPRLSHLFLSPLSENLLQPMATADCHNDVTCYPQWAMESNATVKMVFTDYGETILCTGTLLNDTDPTTFIPYLLSANHCISTQSAASTLQTYWFYRSASCGGELGSYQTRTGGATLLYSTESTDISFMRLSSDPPPGAVFAGWNASLPSINQSLTGLHQPAGVPQKISFGRVGGFGDCFFIGSVALCVPTDSAIAGGFFVDWESGTVEAGSSGSGIFNANHQLVGTLSVGTSDACAADRFGGYGRFDVPYYAALHQWLDNPPSGSCSDTFVSIQGNVHLPDGTPVCAMVLANGQYTFSCDGAGSFNLTVPLDDNCQITLFSFADGFAPYKTIADSSSFPMHVLMQPAAPGSPLIKETHSVSCAAIPNRVNLVGTVSSASGQPLCAMVLANGQHLFSCDPTGSYNLQVPLDAADEVTLFAFADGFQPSRTAFSVPQCGY